MKKCTRCGEKKNFSEFYSSKQTKDGLMYRCINCHKVICKENRESASSGEKKDHIESLIVRRFHSSKGSAKTRDLSFLLSLSQYAVILKSERCHYCGITLSEYNSLILRLKGYDGFDRAVIGYKNRFSRVGGEDLSLFSVDRMDSRIGYSKENCVPCCFMCNSIKSNTMSYDESIRFLPEISGRIRSEIELEYKKAKFIGNLSL